MKQCQETCCMLCSHFPTKCEMKAKCGRTGLEDCPVKEEEFECALFIKREYEQAKG